MSPFGDGTELRLDRINLYQLVDLVVFPATTPDSCSMAELLANGSPQPPQWFISHWLAG